MRLLYVHKSPWAWPPYGRVVMVRYSDQPLHVIAVEDDCLAAAARVSLRPCAWRTKQGRAVIHRPGLPPIVAEIWPQWARAIGHLPEIAAREWICPRTRRPGRH